MLRRCGRGVDDPSRARNGNGPGHDELENFNDWSVMNVFVVFVSGDVVQYLSSIPTVGLYHHE